MSLRTIAVHVDNSPSAAARIDVAIALARKHAASLVGVHPVGSFTLPMFLDADPGLSQALQDAAAADAARAKIAFEAQTMRAGLAAEWRQSEGDPTDVLAISGRCADLVVVGQHDPDRPVFGTPSDLAEKLVFAIGRPLLVVPYIGAPGTLGQYALVAWNASREATRAVNDALPLLRQAKRVSIVAINPEEAGPAHGEIPCTDICLHLARHGVHAEAVQLHGEDIDAGNLLLAYAADTGIDLVVMGAYSRSRLRELVLGGVTRTMLRHMTVPVLMSH